MRSKFIESRAKIGARTGDFHDKYSRKHKMAIISECVEKNVQVKQQKKRNQWRIQRITENILEHRLRNRNYKRLIAEAFASSILNDLKQCYTMNHSMKMREKIRRSKKRNICCKVGRSNLPCQSASLCYQLYEN